jgi:hypothetical protein
MDPKCEFAGEDWVGLICLGEVLRECVFGLHFWKRKAGGGGEGRNWNSAAANYISGGTPKP